MSAAPDPASPAGKRFPARDRFALAVVGAGEAGCAAAPAAPGRALPVDEHPLDPGLIGLDVPFLFGGRVGASAQNPARLVERVAEARPGLPRAVEAGFEVALSTRVRGVSGAGRSSSASPTGGRRGWWRPTRSRSRPARATW